ncbi:MAG: GntR family transcriptional regulator [Pseudonocardia sp.]|uniref:GntR family transcriptional regulator n=1 Tax=unclassified Pseudonocardia TaxID=2619320 RepID=UPI00086B6EFD|nr:MULTISPECIES: GntR family transcriptional regulator [unclassified Pseudonocardia]MBN9109433.1 GntR family transcriptional regulator [Pseudonocardia sp.]ODU29928.1 MAG: GntR family transcriptional regulator [Pseudonocardia sp. SCN 72-51]ODV08133.1 MAG: GntR family transcriptional regulator [Pseudonocardia sp. SCN 73-27]
MTAESELADVGGLGAQSLVELAARRLRAEILSGSLAPGERLVEEQLTRRFGTSRAPLREALRLLGQQGLVEHLPRRGVRVTRLSPTDIDELFGLRDVLERFAVDLALGAGPPPADRLAELERATARIERASAAGETLDQAEAHREFHLALVGLAGHQHLLRVYEPVILQLQLYMATNMRREAEVRPATSGAQRHRRLLEAVASGDHDAVVDALGAHGARTYLAPELEGS